MPYGICKQLILSLLKLLRWNEIGPVYQLQGCNHVWLIPILDKKGLESVIPAKHFFRRPTSFVTSVYIPILLGDASVLYSEEMLPPGFRYCLIFSSILVIRISLLKSSHLKRYRVVKRYPAKCFEASFQQL